MTCFHSVTRNYSCFYQNSLLQRVSGIKDHGNVQIWKYFVTKFRLYLLRCWHWLLSTRVLGGHPGTQHISCRVILIANWDPLKL